MRGCGSFMVSGILTCVCARPLLSHAVRIGIDSRLTAYRAGGISQHVRRLVDGLAALQGLGAPEEFVVLEHRRGRREADPAAVLRGVAEVDGFRNRLPRRYLWTPPHHRLEGWALPVELAPLR